MPARILLVDDNRDTLRVYTRALTRTIKPKNGDHISTEEAKESVLEVECADTIALAIEKLKTMPVEILVVDLKIPGLSGEEMGGLELISASMQLDPLRPIIVITGYGTIELARRTLTQGAFDFIEKSATAVDDLVNAVLRAFDQRDQKIRQSGNPFTRMTGVEPTFFGGRTKELKLFEETITRALNTKFCEHFLALGEWGIGKSTLLNEYKKICQSRGHIACVVPLEPLQAGTRLGEATRSLVEGILRDLPYPISKFKKVVDYFESAGLSVLGTGLQLTRASSKKDLSPQAFLHDTLIKLWQDLEGKTGVFVVLLDDLDNFMAVPEIVMTIRQTLSMSSIRETKILFGIASTPSSWLNLTSTKKHNPISRYFVSQVKLDPLNQEEVFETIIKSLAGSGVSFSPEVIGNVFAYTQGHPFEVQVLCYHLFKNQMSRRVDIEVWDKSLIMALKDLGLAIFDHWYDQASGEESKILRAVAQSEDTVSVKQIQSLVKAGVVKVSPKNTSKYLQRLAEKNLVTKSKRGQYEITDKMFRAYIRSRRD